MTRQEALKTLQTDPLAGPDSLKAIKAAFVEGTQPDLSTLLFRLRQTCGKREAAFKSTGFLSDDEKVWCHGLLQEIEETAARLKSLLDASPTMASEEERRRVMVKHLKNKQKFRQIQSR